LLCPETELEVLSVLSIIKLVCFVNSLEALVKQVTRTAHIAITVIGEGKVIKENLFTGTQQKLPIFCYFIHNYV
jgi:hypothetical protein